MVHAYYIICRGQFYYPFMKTSKIHNPSKNLKKALQYRMFVSLFKNGKIAKNSQKITFPLDIA